MHTPASKSKYRPPIVGDDTRLEALGAGGVVDRIRKTGISYSEDDASRSFDRYHVVRRAFFGTSNVSARSPNFALVDPP